MVSDSLPQALITRFGGTPLGAQDAALFRTVADAASCAISLQKEALEGETMPRVVLDAVQPGAEALPRRASYLLAAAHPGQILVAKVVAEAAASDLPPEARLDDLGFHRLADLHHAEHVWQLRHPNLPADFPPLRSLDLVPNNLPLQLTAFVGRTSEISHIEQLLSTTRILTLVGAGGCGKTRLALHVAAEVAHGYPDGVWWIDLASVSDDRQVAAVIASALGVRELPFQAPIETLEKQLIENKLLLLLDNCEHVISATVGLAEALLRAAPSITILTTSREPLRIDGETTFSIPPLSVPAATDIAPRELVAYDSVELFADRAAKSEPGFRLTSKTGPLVAEICRRLDGLPLAIELAAARTRTLALAEISLGLDDRFRLLTGGARTAPPRHQALEASVEWSYELLEERERTVLAIISVFVGGFTFAAAEAVCPNGDIQRDEVLEVLYSLLDRSLLQSEEGPHGSRYRQLETIRDYAARKLEELGGGVATRDRHLDYYTTFAEEAQRHLESAEGPWLDHIEAEIGNLRAAVAWAVRSGNGEKAQRLVAALPFYWVIRGRLNDGRDLLDAALSVPAPPIPRAKALVAGAHVALNLMDVPTVRVLAEEASALARDAGDEIALGRALTLGGWSVALHEPAAARVQFEDAIGVTRANGDKHFLAFSLSGLGYLEQTVAGDVASARTLLREALDTARANHDLLGMMGNLFRLGWAVALQGDFSEAARLAEECVVVARELRDIPFESAGLQLGGTVAVFTGDYDRAQHMLDRGLELGRDAGAPIQVSLCLWALGLRAYALGDSSLASTYLEEALGFLQALTLQPFTTWTRLMLADAAAATGDEAGSHTRRDEATDAARTAGNKWAIGRCLVTGARRARAQGDPHRAAALLHDGLTSMTDTGDKAGMAEALEELAGAEAATGSAETGARLLAATDSMRDSIAYARFPVDRPRYDATIAALRLALGPEAFEAAWKEGRSLSSEEALAYASRGRGRRRRPSTGWESLTPTEVAVVSLVAKGLTNPEIGQQLFISKRTVGAHLSRVFTKLGVSSRAELAAEATRRQI